MLFFLFLLLLERNSLVDLRLVYYFGLRLGLSWLLFYLRRGNQLLQILVRSLRSFLCHIYLLCGSSLRQLLDDLNDFSLRALLKRCLLLPHVGCGHLLRLHSYLLLWA